MMSLRRDSMLSSSAPLNSGHSASATSTWGAGWGGGGGVPSNSKRVPCATFDSRWMRLRARAGACGACRRPAPHLECRDLEARHQLRRHHARRLRARGKAGPSQPGTRAHRVQTAHTSPPIHTHTRTHTHTHTHTHTRTHVELLEQRRVVLVSEDKALLRQPRHLCVCVCLLCVCVWWGGQQACRELRAACGWRQHAHRHMRLNKHTQAHINTHTHLLPADFEQAGLLAHAVGKRRRLPNRVRHRLRQGGEGRAAKLRAGAPRARAAQRGAWATPDECGLACSPGPNM